MGTFDSATECLENGLTGNWETGIWVGPLSGNPTCQDLSNYLSAR